MLNDMFDGTGTFTGGSIEYMDLNHTVGISAFIGTEAKK
jgi:hypothetical protein